MFLARRIAQSIRRIDYDDLPPEAIAKVKIALLDYLSCAYESLDLPWSRQASQLRAARGNATVIGDGLGSTPADAAFVNAILGHGLVREDMHIGSVSHLGVVVFPTLLALAEQRGNFAGRPVAGRDFITGVVCGYETGAAIGKALMDAETVRVFRPTGITGPLGAAAGAARMLGLDEDAIVSALALAANTTAGLNEWPYSGADDMFFHAGFAARNAVTSVGLAELGAKGSESALDGRAGLFTALRRPERAAAVELFAGPPEILAVYHKPVPACNYAQTAAQAALALATRDGIRGEDIAAVRVTVSAAALHYPGCNAPGPFERMLQAKMSIQHCVAATLARGEIAESNYRALEDPEILRLAAVTKVEEDSCFTQAYPRRQGSEVAVTLRDGRGVGRRLDDVIPATPQQVRDRFRPACAKVLGAKAASAIEAQVDGLESSPNVVMLTGLLAPRRRRRWLGR
jgi:2-methylcitrate dehydratase PrpD